MKRRKLFTKLTSLMLACIMVLSTVFAGNVLAAEGVIEDVVVKTSVIPAGQYPETIKVTVSDPAVLEGLEPSNFSISGQATSWLSSSLHSFTATIGDVAVDGNEMTLTFGDFPEKYVYVDNYTVTCSTNADLTFKVTKDTTTITPIADEFEKIRDTSGSCDGFDYNLFTPEDTSKPQPIVIAFHGYGDEENLYHNKLAVAWADPVNQAERPCYVLAPMLSGLMKYQQSSSRQAVYTHVYNKVQEMIDAGQVDPDRIYVTGKSYGGGATYEFLLTYPDLAAGAIAMCGETGSPYGNIQNRLSEIAHIPLWIAHATTDPTVSVSDSRNAYQGLLDAGSTVVKFKEYSDEEMTAAGVTPEMSNHSSEAVVLEDVRYMEWLFAQRKGGAVVEEDLVKDVKVNTSVRPSGHCLETLEVTVTDAAALEGLTAEDFSFAGQAAAWMSPSLHDFTATVSDVAVDGDKLTLTIADFTEKYFYVDNFTVTCSANPELTFTSDKISSVVTPIADDFEQIRTATGGEFDYNLFTPEDTSEPQPIVIAFHGYGDTDNLLQNKLAVAWADPVNQADRPCYVIAPLIPNYGASARDTVFENVYNKVQEMIEDGKVDPRRIYVVGKSYGGLATYGFLQKYPDAVAGAIPMCGALQTGERDNIEKMVDIPMWIAHAEHDDTVNVESSRTVYNRLLEAGSTVVKYKEFTDAEMNAAGVDGTKIGYHTVEMAVLEDVQFMEWLFAQVKKVKFAIVSNPEDATDMLGKDATFTVEATGEGLTYQWQYQNVKSAKWYNSSMPGSDTTAVTVPVTELRNGQQYRCIVTDAEGNELISEAAVMTVLRSEVVITVQPEDFEGAVGDMAVFAVEAEGDIVSYQWQYKNTTSSNWYNSSMEGADTATLNVKVTNTRNGQQYRCVITDATGNTVVSEAGTIVVK